MMYEIKAGNINCVVVKDLSRFGRDYIETGRHLERIFPDLGVRFISMSDNIDSIKQTYDLLLPIKNIFNEQYARDISQKIQAVVKTKQKSGEFIGAFASYGYKKSPIDKNKLIIDEYAAKVVQKIFALYIQGKGKLSITKILNEEGVLCPSEYKKLNGENYVNSNRLETTSYWTYSTINVMLHNEIYIGNMVQGKKNQRMRGKQRNLSKDEWIIVENTHEAIIDKDTWEKTQVLLNKRTRDMGLNENVNIFAGFIKCGDCGRSMCKNLWYHKDRSRVYVFYCGTYKRVGKEYCTPHMIRYDILQNIVLEDLRIIIKNIDDIKALIKANEITSKKKKMVSEKDIRTYKSEIDKMKKLKKSVYEDYKEGLITKEDFISYRDDYIEKEQLYEKQLQTLEEKKDEDVSDILDMPWLKRLLELRDIKALDRDIVVEMIDAITVYENKKIKIIYNFTNELESLFSPIYCIDEEEKVVV